MKVLQVYKDYSPVLGGIENHIRLLCRGLRDCPDIEPTVLVTSPKTRTSIEEIDGVRVIKAGRLATISSTPISLSLFYWMNRLEADLIHLHTPYPVGELAYLLCGRGRKMVVTYHSDVVRQKYLRPFYEPILKRILFQSSAIVASSPNYIRTSRYLAPWVKKCVVIPYGIDLERLALTDSVRQRVEEIRQTHGHPLILFVGLLRYYKGLSFLIEAMRQIDARLLVVGEGPERKKWESLRRKLSLKEKVTFLGHVSDPELVALYHASDVSVLPSIHRSEAFGIVQLEAMACGKPVVSTELDTGTSFVNLHGTTGLVVPPEDSTALAKAINDLLSDPGLRHSLGEAARGRVKDQFSSRTMLENLLQLYRHTHSA